MKRKEEPKALRMLRWAAAFLLCLTMGIGSSAIQAEADETPFSVTEQWMISKTTESYYGPGRITFRNVRSDLTGLYITKTVENESEDDPAPEGDEFSFLLKTGMSSDGLSPSGSSTGLTTSRYFSDQLPLGSPNVKSTGTRLAGRPPSVSPKPRK